MNQISPNRRLDHLVICHASPCCSTFGWFLWFPRGLDHAVFHFSGHISNRWLTGLPMISALHTPQVTGLCILVCLLIHSVKLNHLITALTAKHHSCTFNSLSLKINSTWGKRWGFGRKLKCAETPITRGQDEVPLEHGRCWKMCVGLGKVSRQLYRTRSSLKEQRYSLWCW